jgi:cytochrome P450
MNPSTTFPGPTPLELLRSVPGILSNPLAYLQQSAHRYGDFVRFQAGPVTAVLINHPDAIKHVLVDNHRNYTKDTIQYNALSAVTGRGLLTSDGDFWFRQRRLMQPSFTRQHIQSFGGAVSTAVERMVARWQAEEENAGANKNGSPAVIDLDAEMMRTTLEIVGQALFSLDLSQEAPVLTRAVITCLDYIMYGARHITLPDSIPTPRSLRFKRALAALDRAVYEIIDWRRGAPPQGDLLDMLLVHLDETGANGMTLKQLRDEVITLLIAGHETVASALTWACYLLSTHPPALQKLRTELATALNGRLPGVDDLPNLPYARMVFDEALRLYPPAWLITRKAAAEDTTEGFTIPAGALVIIGTSAMHHHPAYWPDPDAFDPERFTPERSEGRPRYAYLPFGGGPRLCIGNNFALMEAPLILAGIFQNFHLQIFPGHKVEPDPLVTIRPRGGLPVKITRA